MTHIYIKRYVILCDYSRQRIFRHGAASTFLQTLRIEGRVSLFEDHEQAAPKCPPNEVDGRQSYTRIDCMRNKRPRRYVIASFL